VVVVVLQQQTLEAAVDLVVVVEQIRLVVRELLIKVLPVVLVQLLHGRMVAVVVLVLLVEQVLAEQMVVMVVMVLVLQSQGLQ
jgi:hypothetical protein